MGVAHKASLRAEHVLSSLRDRFSARHNRSRPVRINGYGGYANDDVIKVSGRVLYYDKRPEANPHNRWRNLLASYRRLESDEIGNEPVRLRVGQTSHDAVTDEEGYVSFEVSRPKRLHGHREVTLELPARHNAERVSVRITCPSPTASFGIISDLDDTVLITGATSFLQMMRLTLFESSASRVAFPGVGAFYSALSQGDQNPLFYVSSSPWNLHDFLEEFLRLNRIPRGPLLLRDLGLDQTRFIAGRHLDHKLAAIRGLLDFYPALKFVLIGDSGQKDPEVYARIVREYPGRIHCIYVRDASDKMRDTEVRRLMQETASDGVDMLLVPDTLAAAHHAAACGLIDERAVEQVRQSVAQHGV